MTKPTSRAHDPEQSLQPLGPSLPVIGIVGGIGSGKSTLARWVASHAKVLVVDADRLGHESLTKESVKDRLRSRFGRDIFDAQCAIIRSELAKRVFGDDPERKQARKDLEAIVHPEIERGMDDAFAQAHQTGMEAVLLDAPILFEAGWNRHCQAVVFIDTPDDQRLKNVQARSGWTEHELRKREASQLSLSEKRRRSDAVIRNEGTVDQAGQQLLDFLRERRFLSCNPPVKSSKRKT